MIIKRHSKLSKNLRVKTSDRFRLSLKALSYLSVDVALGAISIGLFFCEITKVDPPNLWWLLLFLSTIIVYNIDHLMDSNGRNRVFNNPRRDFHRVNKTIILYFISLLGILTIGLAFFLLSWGDFVIGLGIFLLCIAYFGLIRFFPFLPKEIAVAFLYILGILYLPLRILYARDRMTDAILYLGIFFFLALQNLITNSWLDRNHDRDEGFENFSNRWGSNFSRNLIYLIGMGGFTLSFIVFTFPENILPTLIFAINFSLPFLFIRGNGIDGALEQSQIKTSNSYRSIGEWGYVLFCIPVLEKYL